MVSKKAPNDTDKEERTYEPFQGAKSDFIKSLEKKEIQERVLENFENAKKVVIKENKKDGSISLEAVPKKNKKVKGKK